MSNEQTSIVKPATAAVDRFSTGVENYLTGLGLPSENVLVELDERLKVFQNLPALVDLLDDQQRNGAMYECRQIVEDLAEPIGPAERTPPWAEYSDQKAGWTFTERCAAILSVSTHFDGAAVTLFDGSRSRSRRLPGIRPDTSSISLAST